MSAEIYFNSEWRQLDFIGSGGALGMLPTGQDWKKYEYDLSFLPEMSKTKLRFKVNLDPSEVPAEGIYIDDIMVKSQMIIFTDIEDEVKVSNEFKLQHNYPNPFNPSTNIGFSLPKSTLVKLTIYDLQGKIVAELTNKEFSAGKHIVKWNANNYSSGIYFYRMETEDFVKINKCLFIK